MFPTIPFDVDLLYAINITLSNSVFDVIMPFITNSKVWLPLYILMFIVIAYKGIRNVRRTGDTRLLLVFAALLFIAVAVDQLSSHLLKETIARPRPFLDHTWVRQLVATGGGSFPSNHALNNTAAAVILSKYFKRWAPAWWCIALVVSYSRMYVGVHYPTDILGGIAIGAAAALLLIVMIEKLTPVTTDLFSSLIQKTQKR